MACRILVPLAFMLLLVPRAAAAQPVTVSAGAVDVASLMVHREGRTGGYRAQLATHELTVVAGVGPVVVSAALYLPNGGSVAPRGLVVFLLPAQRKASRAGTIRMHWQWAGADTVLAFATRTSTKRGEVAYAAEVDVTDLRFLALADRLEVTLPDGTRAIVGMDLRRRLELLTRVPQMTAAQRDELVAYTRALDEAVQSDARRDR